MPYKNIIWVKLEKRLLNDPRFFLMSENSQLIFVKLLMFAAETENKIQKNPTILKACLRCQSNETEIKKCLDEIKKNFPKFKETPTIYYFAEWKNRVNQLYKKGYSKDIPGIFQEYAGDRKEKRREDKIREEKSDFQKSADFKNRNSSSPKGKDGRRPTYRGMEMRQTKEGKWWCIPLDGGKWIEFRNKNEDWKEVIYI